MSFSTPSLDEIKKTSAPDCTHAALVHTTSSDLHTLIDIYLKLANKTNGKFILESVEKGENVGRFSFIGFDPTQTLSTSDVDVLIEVEKIVSGRKLLNELPFPFAGGAVGFVGFEACSFYEPKKLSFLRKKKDTLGIPLGVFVICDRFIVFDHVKKEMSIVFLMPLDDDLEKAYANTCREMVELKEIIELPTLPGFRGPTKPYKQTNPRSNFSKQAFEDAVKKCRQHIIKGDIFQVVLSQRLETDVVNVSPFDLYRKLRTVNPSPYMYYLDFEDYQIIGSSPECLLKVGVDRVIETHPIAGTRPRGATEKEDNQLAEELLNDPKEIAEHVMLVDLGRNDLGKVCEPGSVVVTKRMQIEKYSRVMHIVSNVQGKLRQDQSVFDAFRSVFPAGTVSGAPKIRAMEIIGKLEPIARGPYAGAVGYMSYNGSVDTAITIRTMFMKDGIITLQAGAGIVYDSNPTKEYQECYHKASALLRAIGEAEADCLASSKSVNLENVSLSRRFGKFGGSFVPETLYKPLQDCAKQFQEFWMDPAARRELDSLLHHYVGRPTPLYYAKKLSGKLGGAQIYFKREDLAHTGAHKINAAIAQAVSD